MKIYDRNLTGASAAEAGRTQDTQNLSRAGKDKSATAVNSASDRVELSGSLSRLSQVLSASDSSRASRVQTLAAQYQSGNYKPDPMATSKGMIAEAMSTGL